MSWTWFEFETCSEDEDNMPRRGSWTWSEDEEREEAWVEKYHLRNGVIVENNNDDDDDLKIVEEGWKRLKKDQEDILLCQDTHQYFFKGLENEFSVTKLLKRWFPFDRVIVSEMCVFKAKYNHCVVYKDNDVDVEMSAANIRNEWEKKMGENSEFHKKIEHMLMTQEITDDMRDMLYPLNDYMKEKNFTFYQSEVKLFVTDVVFDGKKINIGGAIDALYHNKKGEAIVVDWKRCKPKFKVGSYMADKELSKYPDTNFWQYSAQLNLYALMLKKAYNITTVAKLLVFIDKDNIRTRIFHAAQMPELEQIIKW
ncbi:hypothetical protein [Diatraea saccharalis granulovirus]|uniref:Uncharacterized protein n=1 Tax=Diatraea saccharalis granulovirus TaxID=1675862 RepID=A0A0R7EYW9_9BBAC|nr:hypothetical protein [Diatraea saccharalis granulovirus]AKN80785.1 hypothetical protein [Diatraea saccharalis granulovirus]